MQMHSYDQSSKRLSDVKESLQDDYNRLKAQLYKLDENLRVDISDLSDRLREHRTDVSKQQTAYKDFEEHISKTLKESVLRLDGFHREELKKMDLIEKRCDDLLKLRISVE